MQHLQESLLQEMHQSMAAQEPSMPSFMDKLKEQKFICQNFSNGCDQVLYYGQILEHERVCKYAKVFCLAYQHCRSIILRQDIQQHQANCRFYGLEYFDMSKPHQNNAQLINYFTHRNAMIQTDLSPLVQNDNFQNTQLTEKLEEKETVIQNLMEKINYLQRRVVFLENEIYELQNSSSEEDRTTRNKKNGVNQLNEDLAGLEWQDENSDENQNSVTVVIRDNSKSKSPNKVHNHHSHQQQYLLDLLNSKTLLQHQIDSKTEPFTQEDEQVSEGINFYSQLSSEFNLSEDTNIKSPLRLSQSPPRNKFQHEIWYLPKMRKNVASLNGDQEIFQFFKKYCTFEIKAKNKMFLLQQKSNPFKYQKDQQHSKLIKLAQASISMIDYPKDAYLLIGLMPRDNITNFQKSSDLLKFIELNQSGFYRLSGNVQQIYNVDISSHYARQHILETQVYDKTQNKLSKLYLNTKELKDVKRLYVSYLFVLTSKKASNHSIKIEII
ncbi:traf-type zinc finger family protein [Stylonychia lemnae]|uniref:Traf-type zinc finger family protein n=1 Tax=Stylonychia lemnae TaxID=5949 RepID=A0A078ACM9_STYLE|nr:traf-type zinc finger family protein [Stylonychia lemnae]|eukprot:CDW80010.1 traf-type zinc finger family protein [Stylonychia lemnae]